LLVIAVRAGADRQAMHERLRQHAMTAWTALKAGQINPLEDLLATDPEICRYLTESEIRSLMDARQYLGDAPHRARLLAQEICK